MSCRKLCILLLPPHLIPTPPAGITGTYPNSTFSRLSWASDFRSSYLQNRNLYWQPSPSLLLCSFNKQHWGIMAVIFEDIKISRFMLYIRINSKQIRDLNMKLCTIEESRYVYGSHPSQPQNSDAWKMNTFSHIKYIFCKAKTTISRIQR